MSWNDQKRWSDFYMPQIKGILGKVLICDAPLEEDRKRNTDLLMRHTRIACRMRSYSALVRWPNDFTIRSGLPGGSRETEIHKLIEGYGDYLFYGFANEREDGVAEWFVGDLKRFRLWYAREGIRKGKTPGIQRRNYDGTQLSAFDRRTVESEVPGFIVAESRGCLAGSGLSE